MARPRLGASFEIILPSGVKGTLRAHRKPERPRDLGSAIALGAVETELDLHGLALADANVIEAVLAAMGAIESEPAKLECRNCGESFASNAASALPIAPLLAPSQIASPHRLPEEPGIRSQLRPCLSQPGAAGLFRG